MPPFWLSHHHPDEWNRTYEVGGVRLCARCLGTYPVMFAGIAVQFALGAPLEWKSDGWWSIGLLLPALYDWAYGRFRPQSGSNTWRTITGIALGLALARTLYIHIQRPLPVWLLVQVGVVTVVSVPVILATYNRARRR